LVEKIQNRYIAGERESCYIYRLMADKNVRVHNYYSDHIDESPQENYQKFIDVNILYIKNEDGKEY